MTEAEIRKDVLREMRQRIALLDPNSPVLELLDQVYFRWAWEGLLDEPAPGSNSSTMEPEGHAHRFNALLFCEDCGADALSTAWHRR